MKQYIIFMLGCTMGIIPWGWIGVLESTTLGHVGLAVQITGGAILATLVWGGSK